MLGWLLPSCGARCCGFAVPSMASFNFFFLIAGATFSSSPGRGLGWENLLRKIGSSYRSPWPPDWNVDYSQHISKTGGLSQLGCKRGGLRH